MTAVHLSVGPSRAARAARAGGCLPPHVPHLDADVAKAFWYELKSRRRAVHHRHGVWSCDTEFRVCGLRFGSPPRTGSTATDAYRLLGTCPCRDLVADAFQVVVGYLTDHAGTLVNPGGAVRKHLRYRLTDLDRHDRAERGAPARPETVAANRHGRALPDDFHRAVLVMLVDEAGCHGPLRGHEGLLRKLADRCAGRFGGTADDYRHRLPAVLRLIERTCRQGPRVNVGTDEHRELVTWWEAYVDRPLGRRADPADLPVGVPSDHAEIPLPDVAAAWAFDLVGDTDQIVLDTLTDAVATASGGAADIALREAIADLGFAGVLPEARTRVLLEDPGGLAVVLSCVRDLLAGTAVAA